MEFMPVIIAIPARFGSTRLPGKALRMLAGRPLISHVVERALAYPGAQVVVATDDRRIADVVQPLGVQVCMTQVEHATGSDRLAECARRLGWADQQIVINLQGDEPLMPLSCLSAVAQLLERNLGAAIATLATPITSSEELFDANCVKVVTRKDGRALYFSRAAIPWARDSFATSTLKLPEATPFARHLGVYAYRASALKRLAEQAQTPLERTESLEQLRALEMGLEIVVGAAPEAISPGVDTEADLKRVESQLLLAGAPLTGRSGRLLPKRPKRVLFVCMGNICRSPLSLAYALKLSRAHGLANGLELSSRGTHAGQRVPADLRTQAIARAAGVDLAGHRAAPMEPDDYIRYDLIIGHDERNMRDLADACPPGLRNKLKLLMEFAPQATRPDVPDPYTGDHDDFILAWQLIKQGVDGLFEELKQ